MNIAIVKAVSQGVAFYQLHINLISSFHTQVFSKLYTIPAATNYTEAQSQNILISTLFRIDTEGLWRELYV